MPAKSAHKDKRSSTTNWKVVQHRSKTAKKTKLALFVLGLIVLTLFSSKAVTLINDLQKPLTTDKSIVKREHLWNANFNLNLVVRGRSIEVLSYNPNEKKIVIVKIPDDTYMAVFNRGNWKLSAIYDLGQSEEVPKGRLMLKSSLSWFLAEPIDGYLQVQNQFQDKTAQDLVESLKKNPFQQISLIANMSTDLTIPEIIRLGWGITQVRFDKVKVLDLATLGLLDKSSLADGTEVFIGDPNKIDTIASNLAESKISQERISVAIFNATDIPGLAQKAQRLISNLGGNVIITTNASQKQKNSRVFGIKSKTLEKLKEIFEIDCHSGPKCDIIEDQEINSSRAQIKVVVGEDFLKSF